MYVGWRVIQKAYVMYMGEVGRGGPKFQAILSMYYVDGLLVDARSPIMATQMCPLQNGKTGNHEMPGL